MNPRLYHQKPLLHPFDVEPVFYTEYDFRVVVEIKVNHTQLHGHVGDFRRIAKGPGRYYLLEYKPEKLIHSEDDHEDTIRGAMEYWLSPDKEQINADQYALGFVLVRRAYNRARTELGLTNRDERRLFKMQDVLTAFPWLSQQTVCYRIKRGFINLKHRAKGKGSNNEFSLAELVHVAVVDEIASLGAFTDLSRVNAVIAW
jgi:hypothetical protein